MIRVDSHDNLLLTIFNKLLLAYRSGLPAFDFYALVDCLLFDPGQESGHIRMLAQFFERVQFLRQLLIAEHGVNLSVASRANIDRWTWIEIFTPGVLFWNEMMHG